jgi:predicted GNAT family acetyltransferase
MWMGPAYCFPDQLESPAYVVRITRENSEFLRGGFAHLIPELDQVQPFVAVIEDEQAVSVCHSVRLSSQAHEAGVDTLESYRRRGYATTAVAGWAVTVRALGFTPLYSTSWDNVASQGVARRFGSVWC